MHSLSLPTMSQTQRELTCKAFTASFGGTPLVVSISPARVELLGNHTDHNDGLVLAAAIDRVSVVAIRPERNSTHVARVHSLNLDQSAAGSVMKCPFVIVFPTKVRSPVVEFLITA